MRQIQISIVTFAATCLAACGGVSSGGVDNLVSAPPPPPSTTIIATETIGDWLGPTPALVSGTYSAIAVEQSSTPSGSQLLVNQLADNALQVKVDGDLGYRYTISIDPALVPPDLWTGSELSDEGEPVFRIGGNASAYGYEYHVVWKQGSVVVDADDFPVTTTTNYDDTMADYGEAVFWSEIGQQYASLGYWAAGSSYRNHDSIAFAYGERTPVGAVPVSGTATYTNQTRNYDFDEPYAVYIGDGRLIRSLGEAGNVSYMNAPDITLEADFGARTIDGEVSYVIFADDQDYSTLLTGSAAITAQGDFLMPLNGTRDAGVFSANDGFLPDGSTPVTVNTGSMQAAFFGPNGQEIAGTVQLPDLDGDMLIGAFVATDPMAQ